MEWPHVEQGQGEVPAHPLKSLQHHAAGTLGPPRAWWGRCAHFHILFIHEISLYTIFLDFLSNNTGTVTRQVTSSWA